MSALDAHCLLLRLQAELSGPEGVFLGHGPLGALEAVQDQLAEEGIPDAPDTGMCCSPFLSTRYT